MGRSWAEAGALFHFVKKQQQQQQQQQQLEHHQIGRYIGRNP
jgi:hypothetical protein